MTSRRSKLTPPTLKGRGIRGFLKLEEILKNGLEVGVPTSNRVGIFVSFRLPFFRGLLGRFLRKNKETAILQCGAGKIYVEMVECETRK